MDQELLLGVLNSAPRVDGEIVDAWSDEAALRSWLDARGLPTSGLPASALSTARSMRDDLRRVARGEQEPQMLNRWLAGAHSVPEIQSSGDLVWRLEVPLGERLATLAALTAEAVLALMEVSAELPGRLRACGNPECELFLLDTSRSNTGRWCDMSTCGNRMKARRHQARLKDLDLRTTKPTHRRGQ